MGQLNKEINQDQNKGKVMLLDINQTLLEQLLDSQVKKIMCHIKTIPFIQAED